MFKLKIQLHGGGGGGGTNTTVQSYQPTAEEKRLWKLQGDYQEMSMPYAQDLLSYSKNLLDQSLGVAQVDFTKLNNESQNMIGQAQQGVSNLANGVLPTAYTDNMQSVINNQVNTAMGNWLNTGGQNGVLNSSVTNQAINDITKNASNTMAEMYNTNIGTLNGLYGQMDTMASDKVTAAAAAQEAAQAPAMNLLNAATGTSSNNISAIGALKNTGTTTSTQTTSSNGNGLLGGLFNTAASFAGGALACFGGETAVLMKDNKTKPIRDVEVGDFVMTYKDGALVPSKVVEVQVTPNRSDILVVDFHVTDSAGVTHTDYVITTQKQAFMGTDGEWKFAQNFEAFTKLKPYFGVSGISVASTERSNECITVYDLKLEDSDNYIAAGLVAKSMY